MQDQGVYSLPPTGIMERWQIYLECAKCREESSCSLAIMAAASIQYFFVASIYRKLACTRLPGKSLAKDFYFIDIYTYFKIFPITQLFFNYQYCKQAYKQKVQSTCMSTRLKYFYQFTISKHCPHYAIIKTRQDMNDIVK